MEILGFDSSFVVLGQMRPRIERFALMLGVRWPSLLVSIGWNTDAFCLPGVDWIDGIDESGESLWFARDRYMVEHFDEWSYTPTLDGEAVVSLSYQALDVSTMAVVVPELETENPSVKRRAYDATLLLPAGLGYEVALLTPEDPAQHHFSGEVLTLFRSAFAGS